MIPERWQQVKAVLGQVLDAPAGDRERVLADACGEDAALRDEVSSLLEAASGGDSVSGARNAVVAGVGALDVRRPASTGLSDLRALLTRALGTQYEILLPLGEGGMGAVYLARELALERFVAIKVLRPDLATAPSTRERFRREARIAAHLSHPGILPLHTFGEVDGIWYFVMGYVRGESLAERLRREGALPHDEVRRIVIELAEALDCAHRNGIVHRDIKPANILLDHQHGRAVLADFGVSKDLHADDGLTSPGALVGSPHYMSPEQAVGAADIDVRSDVYSLGAVAYAMLAGREPFSGSSATEVMHHRLIADPPPLRTFAPDVPPALEALVMRCLAREPGMRWPDARTLRDELLLIDDSEPVLPDPVRDLSGFAVYAAAWMGGWGFLASKVTASDRLLLLFIAALIPAGLAMHVWQLTRDDLRPRQLLRAACWPPRWWGMWWPRRFRRPGDLWGRLPAPARRVRIALSAAFVALPCLILLRRLLRPATPWLLAAIEWAPAGVVAGSVAVAVAGLWWASRRGVPTGAALHLLLGATMPSSAWRSGRVAALLRPAHAGIRPPDADSPADHERAVAELVRLLPAALSTVGNRALRVSRRLLAAARDLDRAILTLSREASNAERDRLTARLASLDAASTADTVEQAELRLLLQQQLALVQRMQGRLEVARRDRTRLVEQLAGIWTQLLPLQAAASGAGAGAGADVQVAAARVERLCSDTEHVLDPVASAPAIVPGVPDCLALPAPIAPAADEDSLPTPA